MKYKNETELLEDSLALPGLPSYMSKFAASEDEIFDLDDIQKHNLLGPHAYAAQNQAIMDSRNVLPSGGGIKREFRRQPVQSSWLHKLVPHLTPTEYKWSRLSTTARTADSAYDGVLSGGVNDQLLACFALQLQPSEIF
ncbi:Enhancer of polycomb-like, N-terminal [Artemisia annua]|uniref:Enhancer of polycomb-like, N-terminal n=1 Tax=Artemisia annua TaxID=35608 RepID=A0A2U1QGI7_ARTAN|nr:Enhancer of polycomb-like, N-terminal [Artemisia annua]